MKRLRWLPPLLFGLVLLSVTVAARAQTPVLRIETGGHGGGVTDASRDASGRVLVTASEDKTARIWSLPELRPIGVLRPPIGGGNEGKLYAVAVSPDGTLAAVGGWTLSPSADEAVLVFNLATKQVVHRIAGVPNNVVSLAFSRDGRLAAGLGGGNGIRIWEIRDWRQSLADPDYKDSVYGLSFAPDGRLAAGSGDGALRLYDPAGQRIVRVDLPAGQRPFRLAFSPDGSRLAVGFVNSVALEVRDGKTLAVRSRPNVARLEGRSLANVAWSSNGQTLLAVGDVLVNGTRPVFAWNGDGMGAQRVLERGFGEKTSAIVPLTSGTALVSERGALAMLDGAGRRVAERPLAGQDLNTLINAANITHRLLLSRDGTQVAWVALGAPDRWLRFDGASIDLTTPSSRPASLADWSDSAGAMQVTGWNYQEAPALNGRALRLRPYERSYSVAVTADRILLGTSFALRLFAPNGTERWPRAIPVPGIPWRVNQSADGRLAVAAYGDGTLRWHRLSDGQELLALFVTADAARWIAWTPSGFYAAGPGAEDLIGWHVNRGPDQAADFFTASKFRDRFSRPDIVRHVLATLDEAEAVRQADAERGLQTRPAKPITDDLPPVIAISAPRDDTQLSGGEATIDYTLRSPSARPVRAVRVLIDGNLAPTTRGLDRVPATAGSSGETRGQVVVAIPPGTTADVTLLAETDTRVSEPAKLRLIGAPAAARPTRPRPNLYAVLVGVSDYSDKSLRLEFGAKDAADLNTVLLAQKGRGYDDVQTRLLNRAGDTRESVMDALEWLRKATTMNDTAIVFLAGHGVNDANNRYFFLPASADPTRLRATAVSGLEMVDLLRNIYGRRVAMIDTCYSGNILGTTFRSAADQNRLVNEFSSVENGLIVLAGSTGGELSQERAEWQNGAFAHALKEGLLGAADYDKDGVVTLEELNLYVVQRVKALTDDSQHPNRPVTESIRDFPIANVK